MKDDDFQWLGAALVYGFSGLFVGVILTGLLCHYL